MKFINDIFKIFTKASIIRSDEQRRAKSIRFAVESIICSVLAVAFALVFWFVLKTLAGDLGDILRIVSVIALGFCILALLISALLRSIVQLTINRKVISWIAFVLVFVAIALSALLIIISLI